MGLFWVNIEKTLQLTCLTDTAWFGLRANFTILKIETGYLVNVLHSILQEFELFSDHLGYF